MGSTRVTTPAPPPPPTPVDPLQASLDFTRAMADPAFQAQLLASEQTFRPQYNQLELNDINQLLRGSGGQMGLLGLQDLAAQQVGQTERSILSQQRAADIGDVEALGGRASEAFLNANPQLRAQLERANQLGQSGDFFGGLEGLIQGGQQFGDIAFDPMQAAQLGAAPTVAQQGYQAERLGDVPTMQGQGYDAAMAASVADVEAERMARGQLGEGLQQAGMGQLQAGAGETALGAAGMDFMGRGGALTPLQARNAAQAARAGGLARGRELGQGAIYDEALARLAQEMQVEQQNVAMGAGLLGQEFGMGQQRLGMASGLYGQDLGLQQANQQAALQAALANQGVSAQQAALNQQAANQAGQFTAAQMQQAGLANQAAAMQYGMANQQAGNVAGQFNAAQALQAGLANQAMAGQYGLSNQQMQQQAALANMQTGIGVQEANRGFAFGQQQQGIGNQAMLGQLRQGQQGADRAYGLQQAQMLAGVASDPFQAILGRPSQAAGLGMQGAQFGAGLAGQPLGPNLFDPNAGINLALQNSANLSNYNANIFGSQAALAGAQAQARGAMIGGIFQGLGAGAGAIAKCWVAREVYGQDNPKWKQFREWLTTRAPEWFYKLYIKHGPAFAEWLKGKHVLKGLIRHWMDGRIKTMELIAERKETI